MGQMVHGETTSHIIGAALWIKLIRADMKIVSAQSAKSAVKLFL